ncbi:MAG: WecB/TagA/CpsF family glycosyltransferase [Synechococcales cyanobacterium CRU_2_2]|nr:WecB/TagA/CpsF family glycosyltransferase [Synechococcales cyanobacterium CRU_2_2]
MGQPVDLLRSYPRWLAGRMKQQQGTHVITLNAEMTMEAGRQAGLAAALQQADLVIPDGAGIVLYLKLYGRQVKKCAGIALAESLIRRAAQLPSASVFFYGGKPGVAEKAGDRWQSQLPTLQVAGVADGYATEETELLQRLQTLQPGVIFVGLGVPRQELWIAANRHHCPNSIWIGVGGSFDIWAGTKESGAAIFADNHLEWAYRLYQEPWRWKRMMALPQFALKALGYRLTGRGAIP